MEPNKHWDPFFETVRSLEQRRQGQFNALFQNTRPRYVPNYPLTPENRMDFWMLESNMDYDRPQSPESTTLEELERWNDLHMDLIHPKEPEQRKGKKTASKSKSTIEDDGMDRELQGSSTGTARKQKNRKRVSVQEALDKSQKIKRPMNSFLIFSQENREACHRTYPNLNAAEVQKMIGERWRELPQIEKNIYQKKARKAKREHLKQNPGYIYKPKTRHSSEN